MNDTIASSIAQSLKAIESYMKSITTSLAQMAAVQAREAQQAEAQRFRNQGR